MSEGYQPLRDTVRDWLARREKIGTDGDDLLIVSGATQIMDLVTKVLCNEGDTVICEEPSFIGSLNCFRSYGCKLAGVPMEADGMDTAALERVLQENPAPDLSIPFPISKPLRATMSWRNGSRCTPLPSSMVC